MNLYFGRCSGNSSRAVFGLEESGVAYERSLIDTRRGEHRTPGYLAINPMGKIPAFSDGPYRLWESNAINWYVAESHPESRLLPQTPQGRASVQRWLFFQAAHVTQACQPIFRNTNQRVREFWKPGPVDEAALERGRNELARYLPVLEQALAGGPWLEGDFSLAEVALAPHLYLVHEGGHDFAPHPHVHDWLQRIWARPAWRRTVALVFDEGGPHHELP